MRIFTFPLRFLLCCIIAGSLLLTSCSIDKDLAKPTFTPDFILPLVYGDLTLKDLTKDSSTIQTDPAGYFKVSFSDTVFQQDLGAQLAVVQNVPDFPQQMSFNISGPNHILTNKEYTYDINLALQLSKLTQLQLNGGTLTLKITNNKSWDFTNLQWDIPGLKIGGVPYLSANIPTVAAGTVNTTVIDLTNADWDLRGKNLDSNSLVFIKLNVGAGTNTGPSAGQGLISMALNGLDVKFSRGRYFTIVLPPFSSGADVLPATFYKNIKSGSLNLTGANVKLKFDNTVGIPFAIDVKVQTTNGVDGTFDSLKTGFLDILKSKIGPVSEPNEFILNDANGLGTTLSNFPTKFDVTAGVGFNQNNDSLNYYVYKESTLKLFVTADIPFAVAFDKLILMDTLKFALFESLGEGIDTAQTKLDTGSLVFKISNGFPYDIDINLLAMNGLSDSIATLANISMDGASTSIIGGEEKVTIPRNSSFDITLTQGLFERLKAAKKIQIRAKLNTPVGVVSPKIYTDYKLGFDVKGRIKVQVKPL